MSYKSRRLKAKARAAEKRARENQPSSQYLLLTHAILRTGGLNPRGSR